MWVVLPFFLFGFGCGVFGVLSVVTGVIGVVGDSVVSSFPAVRERAVEWCVLLCARSRRVHV